MSPCLRRKMLIVRSGIHTHASISSWRKDFGLEPGAADHSAILTAHKLNENFELK